MRLYAEIIDEETKECRIINQVEAEEAGWEQYDLEMDSNGKFYLEGYAPAPPEPTEAEIQRQFEDAIEAMMNETVQQRNYKDIVSACSYAVSTDETFRKEGEACVVWRDGCWRKCYEILAEVKAGKRPIPTLEEVFAELPVLAWD